MEHYDKTMTIPVGASLSASEDARDANMTVAVNNGKIQAYVAAALNIIQKSSDAGGSQPGAVYITGTGRSVTKAISVAEIIKHRAHGLHQVTTIATTRVDDIWEPKESLQEDVDSIKVERQIPTVKVLLSLTPLDPNTPGYQPPLPASEISSPAPQQDKR